MRELSIQSGRRFGASGGEKLDVERCHTSRLTVILTEVRIHTRSLEGRMMARSST